MELIDEKSITEPLESIPNFFAGRSIFVTGCSGFIGRVFIEKILRTCPQIDTIYVLMRPKRGKSIQERIQERTSVPLFDKLRKEYPDFLKKLHVIQGDACELELGMSPEDWKLLQERVSVIFHMAASVRFDDPLIDSVLMNIRGTREVVRLARGMKNLKVLMHVSTTFCNPRDKVVEERLYDAVIDWRTMIELAESQDPFVIRLITRKLLGYQPNTYTFTKALAEHVINDCKDELPVVIVRPSIVGPAFNDPLPGWIDNFNGPMGLFISGGKGVLRVMYSVHDVYLDIIPVDTVCKGIIMACWLRGHQRTTEMPIYNGNLPDFKEYGMGRMIELGFELTEEVPFNEMLYKPYAFNTANRHVFYISVLFLHVLPALVVDSVLRLSSRKPFLLRMYRRIYAAVMALSHFTTQNWVFDNSKYFAMEKYLLSEDHDSFKYDISEKFDFVQYYKQGIIGCRRHLFNESDETLPIALRNYRRLLWLHRCIQALVSVGVLWHIWSYFYAVTETGSQTD